MRRIFCNRACALVFIVNFFIKSAKAENHYITIDNILQNTLEQSPVVKSLDSEVLSKSADAFDVKTLPNPEIQAEVSVPVEWKSSKGRNESSLSITQPFRLSHGNLRNILSSLIEKAARQNKEKDILQILSDVKLAYGKSWAIQERKKALSLILQRANSINQFVKKGVEEGVYGKGEEAVFRAEVGKTQAELKGIGAEYFFVISELSRLSGLAVTGNQLAPPLLGIIPEESAINKRLKEGELMIQNRARLLVDLAKAGMDVAKRDSFPGLSPKLSYSRTNDGVDLIGVGISIPLPFYNQNTAEIKRSEAEINKANLNAQFTQSDAFRESILKATRGYLMRREEIILYENQVLPALQEALKAFEVQVRSGQGSIFQLWQTLREYIDTNGKYLELWTKAYSERIELSILLGEEI